MPIIHLPKPTFSSLVSWNLRKSPIAKPSTNVLQWIHLPIPKKNTRENIEKTKKIPTPPQVTENRPSSKTSGFVTYLPPKGNDWTPPWDPPRSPQKVRKLTRGAPEDPQSSPRALQDPQDVLGATKPDDRLHLDVTGHQPKKMGSRVPYKRKSHRSYVTWIYHPPVHIASSEDTNTQTYVKTRNNPTRSQRLWNLLIFLGVGGRA